MATTLEWQGRVGVEWANKADALDKLLGPVGDVGITELGPLIGKRVMDLGCGAGATSLAMAHMGAQVTGLDISVDLLAKARARDVDSLCEFILTDAATAQFEQSFDALYSRCGAMFFEHPVAAWAHLHKQMKPGATAKIVCWREATQNEWATLPLNAAASILGARQTKPSPSGVPGPFAWADESVFTKVFKESGWADVQHTAIDREVVMECGNDPDPIKRGVLFATSVGPLGSRLRGMGPEIQNQVQGAVAEALQSKLHDGAIRISTSAWVITATA